MDVLIRSLSASCLILPAILIRKFCGKRMPGSVRGVLWFTIGCKLMIPVNLFLPVANCVTGILQDIWPLQVTDNLAGAALPAMAADVFFPGEAAGLYMAGGGDGKGAAVLSFLWLAGAALLTLYFAGTCLYCNRIRHLSLPAEEIPDRERYEYCFPGRHVQIRISDRIESPMTFGFFRPIILLPAARDWQDGAGLCWVLEHEMAHIRRFDSVRKMMLAAVLVCHWFNPAVWTMYVLANRDIELACDSMVLRRMGSGLRAVYANVLLEWAAARVSCNLLASHFMGNFMEERIRNIMIKKRITITGVILSVMLLSSAAVVYAMTPSEDSGDAAAQGKEAFAQAANETTRTQLSGDSRTATVNDAAIPAGQKTASYVEDPTLGGIFQIYTVEEYEAVVEQARKYADGDDGTGSGIRPMEEALEKLKADQGKGEFVIYKPAFEKKWQENGYSMGYSFNPISVMAPELEYESAGIPLTAQLYRRDMERTIQVLDEAVADGQLTPENREIILAKMQDNLERLD